MTRRPEIGITQLLKKEKSESKKIAKNGNRFSRSPIKNIVRLQKTLGNQRLSELLQNKLTVIKNKKNFLLRNLGQIESTQYSDHGYSVQSSSGKGRSLTMSEREYFEPRFGADFSQVRIHTDEKAANAAESIGVQSFTIGNSIFFCRSGFIPESNDVKKLLAHELAHVVQNNHSINNRSKMIVKENDPAEQEAKNVQHEIMKGDIAPEIKTKISSSVVAPNWGAPVCLTLDSYRVEAQYNPESEQLRLIIPNLTPILSFGDPGIQASEVEEAIGLHEPDVLQNREWRTTENGWEIRFDVVVHSSDGRQRLDEFFLPQSITPIEPLTQSSTEIEENSPWGRGNDPWNQGYRMGYASGYEGGSGMYFQRILMAFSTASEPGREHLVFGGYLTGRRHGIADREAGRPYNCPRNNSGTTGNNRVAS